MIVGLHVTDAADAADSDADAAATIRAGSRSRCVRVAATPVLHSQPGRLPPATASTATGLELKVRSKRTLRWFIDLQRIGNEAWKENEFLASFTSLVGLDPP